MPRFKSRWDQERIAGPQGNIAWTDVVAAMNGWRSAADRMHRRYSLSKRCHVAVSAVLNNQYEATMSMTVEASTLQGPSGGSWWPYYLTSEELRDLATIRDIVGRWQRGEITCLPDSTFAFPDPDAEATAVSDD